MGKKWIAITVAGIVVATAGVGGYYVYKNQLNMRTDSIIPVSVATATVGSLAKGEMFSGITDTAEKIPLAPAISSKVTKIYVKVGDKVSKGQPLFAVDPTPMEQTINQAQAGLMAARANLEQALKAEQELNKKNQQEQLAKLNAEYNAVIKARNDAINRRNAINAEVKQVWNVLVPLKDKYIQAKDHFNAMDKLYKQGYITQEEFEEAKTEYERAKKEYEDTRTRYYALQAERDKIPVPEKPKKPSADDIPYVSHPAVAVAKKQVSEAENVYQQVVAIAKPVITAPISGTIEAINGSVGKTASNREIFMVLGNVKSYRVVMNVPQSVIGQFHNNQKVNIFIPSTDKRLQGIVQTIHSADPKTKMCLIEITLPDSTGISASQVAQINVPPKDAKQGIVIPLAALLKEDQKYYVYIAKGDKASKKYVTVLEQNDEQAIVSGIAEGEQVIYKGLSLVNEDVKISIK
jgi:HlyD family secretion protein